MKITLITACFNSVKTLRTAIESVFAQRNVDLEYIVVDGGSTDGTLNIIKEFASPSPSCAPPCMAEFSSPQLDSAALQAAPYPAPPPSSGAPAPLSPAPSCAPPCMAEPSSPQLDSAALQAAPSPAHFHNASNITFQWLSEPDKGMYDAINKGIALATGEIVGILNADDLLETPDTLSHIASAFADGIEVVYADIRFVREDLTTTLRRYSAKHWRPWMHNWGYMPPHPSVYIRRSALKLHGGYKLGYRISADFELMVRYLCRNRLKSAYLAESVVRMRMGGLSTSGWRSLIVLNRENVRANRENGYFSCLAMMLPKYAFKIWGFILPRFF